MPRNWANEPDEPPAETVDKPVDEPAEEPVDVSVPVQPKAVESQPVSWGVELEFVLAFHRHQLEEVLRRFPANPVRPAIVPDAIVDHKRVSSGTFSSLDKLDDLWNLHWPAHLIGIKDDEDNSIEDLTAPRHGLSSGTWQSFRVSKSASEFNRYRTYALEPLLIAQKVLFDKGVPIEVIASVNANPKRWEHAKDGVQAKFEYDGIKSESCFPGTQPAWLYKPRRNLVYDDWFLVRDPTVLPTTRGDIARRLSLPHDQAQQWDSDGMELVSRKYGREEITSGCQKLRSIFDILADTPASGPRSTGVLETVFGGTHVHIGFNWKSKEDVDLYLLRHLGFILLSNEELLSSLHAYRRRDVEKFISPMAPEFVHDKKATNAQNQADKAEQAYQELQQKYHSAQNLHSNVQDFRKRKNIKKDQDVRNKLAEFFFDPDLKSNELFLHLQKLTSVGERAKRGRPDHHCIVDFHRLADLHGYTTAEDMSRAPDPKSPPTIEFRQHGCTLDADEVEHWVKFLFALVSYAERKARQTTTYNDKTLVTLPSSNEDVAKRELSKYGPAPRNIREFCGPRHLHLPRTEIAYWGNRVARYKDSKTVFLENKRNRRIARSLRKARNGKELTVHEVEDLPPFNENGLLRSGTKSLKQGTKADVFEYLKTELNLDEEQDQEQCASLKNSSHTDLVKMVRRMQKNLRDKSVRRYIEKPEDRLP